ncbi:hypothetical protein FB451DRAFT_1392487 [Mycena latifolia]|nr:hypothetical protein FB451DRAFT_1392487 [Mycena latifolia]
MTLAAMSMTPLTRPQRRHNAGRSPASDSSFSSSSSSATLASSEYSASASDLKPSGTSGSVSNSRVHAASLVDPARHSPDPEYIVECVSDTVAFALSSPSARAKRAFVAALPARADVALPTVLTALVYVARARPVLSIALQYALERVWLEALIGTSKYTQDAARKNAVRGRVWRGGPGRGAGEVESVGAALGAIVPRAQEGTRAPAPVPVPALAPSTSSTASASPRTPASAFSSPSLPIFRPHTVDPAARPPPASTPYPAAPRVLVQAARAPARGRPLCVDLISSRSAPPLALDTAVAHHKPAAAAAPTAPDPTQI